MVQKELTGVPRIVPIKSQKLPRAGNVVSCPLRCAGIPNFRKPDRFAVGVDAHIDPLGTIEFAEDFRKNGLYSRGDVGIVPYALAVVGAAIDA